MRVDGGLHSGDHHGRPKPPQTAAEPSLGRANAGLCRARALPGVIGRAFRAN